MINSRFGFILLRAYNAKRAKRNARARKRTGKKAHDAGRHAGKEGKQRRARRRQATRAEHAKNNKGMGFDAALRITTKSRHLCTRLLVILGTTKQLRRIYDRLETPLAGQRLHPAKRPLGGGATGRHSDASKLVQIAHGD